MWKYSLKMKHIDFCGHENNILFPTTLRNERIHCYKFPGTKTNSSTFGKSFGTVVNGNNISASMPRALWRQFFVDFPASLNTIT